MNKLPPELHIVAGTKGENMGTVIPASMRARIPAAEWLDAPDAFNKQKFIDETAEFLFAVYGIGSTQDRHLLTMLADQVAAYLDCCRLVERHGQVYMAMTEHGETLKTNPAASLRDKVLIRIVSLMNELGLTPRGRLSGSKSEPAPVAGLLKGVAIGQ